MMPFGAVNAPATLSRCMNDILEDFVHKRLVIYIDDLCIYSPTLEQHLIDIENVLTRLRANQFYCKLINAILFVLLFPSLAIS